MQNQFFISSQGSLVQNGIMQALADRIITASKGDDDDGPPSFHFILVLPLKPEFAGDWDTEKGRRLKAITYWNYHTLFWGENSLREKLIKGGGITQYNCNTVYN